MRFSALNGEGGGPDGRGMGMGSTVDWWSPWQRWRGSREKAVCRDGRQPLRIQFLRTVEYEFLYHAIMSLMHLLGRESAMARRMGHEPKEGSRTGTDGRPRLVQYWEFKKPELTASRRLPSSAPGSTSTYFHKSCGGAPYIQVLLQ